MLVEASILLLNHMAWTIDHPEDKVVQWHLYDHGWAGNLGLQPADEVEDLLNQIWLIVEKGGPNCPVPRAIGDPRGPIRSFVVGDIVVIHGTPWVCAPFGWYPALVDDAEPVALPK